MLLEELAVADAGHEEIYVSLDIYWEILHLGNKLGSGGCRAETGGKYRNRISDMPYPNRNRLPDAIVYVYDK